ncbi:NEDD4-binding protein 3-B isoform X2 [Esox lucius]|uniref:NEDD4-binding protein 3-B isoform X2 n=1 Tax=Esox lucius TaxID=8010 RepID=UPI001476A99E|nr:NEDD4-binding protein 3-B isoform X2 [Esox lucius]
MATSVQTLPLTRDPKRRLLDTYCEATLPTSLLARYSMGSVGSLVERPAGSTGKGSQAVPQVGPRQTNGVLKKSFNQRELLNYLNITRKEPRAGSGSGSSRKDMFSSMQSIKREQEEENIHTKVYHKDGTEVNISKNIMGGKYEKSHVRPSAFKPVTPKNFSSMQNLYPSKMEDSEPGLSNGLHRAYAHTPKAVSTSSSSPSPSRHEGPTSSRTKAVVSMRGLSQDEDNLSDSGHHSMNSLPPYRPPFRPHLAQISASMGHINAIGSLDRASKVVRPSGVAMGDMATSCRSMATLSRLVPYGGEAPPPYEQSLSLSVEEVVRDLEERLVEKEHELKQVRRNLDESEGAIAQVFEGKQRLWEKEVEELKHLYAAKLRQVSQHAQRSQRAMQLQLNKAQQEKNRLQEKLDAVRKENEGEEPALKGTSPTLEETQWQVCQKSGEISLLKQQLRDSQAEVTSKLSELFQLKTQLRECRAELRNREEQINTLKTALQGLQPRRQGKDDAEDCGTLGSRGSGGAPGSTEERLRAELLLERRQSEAQATAFEEERQTWQTEKEKVIRYQRELQANYLDMFHRNELLDRELQHLRGAGGTLDRELQHLRGAGGTLDRELEQFGGAGGTLDRELQHLGGAGGTLDRELQHLRGAGGTLDRELQHLRGAGGTLDRELQHLRGAGRTLDRELEQFGGAGGTLDRELQQFGGAGGTLDRELQHFGGAGGTLDREIQHLRGAGGMLDRELQQFGGAGGTLERELRVGKGERGGQEMEDYSNKSLKREGQEVKRGGSGRGEGERGDQDSKPPSVLPWIERIESSEI